MSLGEAVVWYVTVWLPGVMIDAFFNYLYFWIPLALILAAFGIFRTKAKDKE